MSDSNDLNSHLKLGDSTVEVTDAITVKKTKKIVDMRARLSLIIDHKLHQDWTIYKAGLLKSVKE